MRYPVLRVIVVMHYLAAVAVAGVAVLGAVVSGASMAGAMFVAGGAASFLVLVGFAEVLRVVMDIEENTRPRDPPRALPTALASTPEPRDHPTVPAPRTEIPIA